MRGNHLVISLRHKSSAKGSSRSSSPPVSRGLGSPSNARQGTSSKSCGFALGSQYVNDFNYLGRTYQVKIQGDGKFRRTPQDITRLKARSKWAAANSSAGRGRRFRA